MFWKKKEQADSKQPTKDSNPTGELASNVKLKPSIDKAKEESQNNMAALSINEYKDK